MAKTILPTVEVEMGIPIRFSLAWLTDVLGENKKGEIDTTEWKKILLNISPAQAKAFSVE